MEKNKEVGTVSISHTRDTIRVPSGLLCKRHWQLLLLKRWTPREGGAIMQLLRRTCHCTNPELWPPPPTQPNCQTPQLHLLHMHPHFRPQLHGWSICTCMSGIRATTAVGQPASQILEPLLLKKCPCSFPWLCVCSMGTST